MVNGLVEIRRWKYDEEWDGQHRIESHVSFTNMELNEWFVFSMQIGSFFYIDSLSEFRTPLVYELWYEYLSISNRDYTK